MVIHALEQEWGPLTYAARALNVHFRTLKRYINENDDVKEALTDIEEANLDAAEATLRAVIEDGNLTATIFYLKTKGKKRGTRSTTSRMSASSCNRWQSSTIHHAIHHGCSILDMMERTGNK